MAIPLALVAAAVLVGVLGLLMTLVGLEGPGDALRAAFGDWIDTLFAPASLPTIIPRLVLFAILIGLAALALGLIASALPRAARDAGRATA